MNFTEQFLAEKKSQGLTRLEAVRIDFDEFYHPIEESYLLGDWFDVHETLKNYNRAERLNPAKWKVARAQALERDNNQCLFPDTWHNRRLQGHHVVPLDSNGDPYSLGNIATLCIRHHLLMHPGLREAFDQHRNGDDTAFIRYVEAQHAKSQYIPPPEAHMVKGIVIERTLRYFEYKRHQILNETEGKRMAAKVEGVAENHREEATTSQT